MPTLTRSCKAWQGLARYSDPVQPGQEDVFLVGPSSTLPERVFPAKVSRDLVGLVSLLSPCKALQDSATFADVPGSHAVFILLSNTSQLTAQQTSLVPDKNLPPTKNLGHAQGVVERSVGV